MKLSIIGDIHGDTDFYKSVCRSAKNPTIQIGDFGLGFVRWVPRWVDTSRHVFIHGNHDNPQIASECDGFLGRYGFSVFHGVRLFFVSGAYSIDREYRHEGIDWWRDEQLSYEECELALVAAERVAGSVDLVVTHDCPEFIYGFRNTTSMLLTEIYRILRPKLWMYGHHHVNTVHLHEGTTFVCVGEKSIVEIDVSPGGEKSE